MGVIKTLGAVRYAAWRLLARGLREIVLYLLAVRPRSWQLASNVGDHAPGNPRNSKRPMMLLGESPQWEYNWNPPGGPGNAAASKDGNTYKITGNVFATVTDQQGSRGQTEPFEFDATCP
jgi:hypothetical protein